MELVILNENQIEMSRFDFKEDYQKQVLKKVENFRQIAEWTKKLLNNLKYSVGVYSLTPDKKDFNISFLNKHALRYGFFNFNNAIGAHLSNISKVFDKNGLILNKMKEVYDTNQSQILFFEYYNENNLYKKNKFKLTKIDDFIYVLGEDETDYLELSQKEETLFDNEVTGIAIVQDFRFVKCNKKYLELFDLKSFDEVIGKKVGYTGSVDSSLDLLYDNIAEMMNGNMLSYSLPVKIEKNGKLIHYFNLNANYIIYNDKPALLVFYNDITEQELNRIKIQEKTKEALVLQKNMDFIQSISNTCSAYKINGEYIRSAQLYKIIERDPMDEDPEQDIFWDIVLDEDKHILKENYVKLTPENDYIEFIIRINTFKGNLKYIHCHIKNIYMDNNRIDVVSFYQDVTDEQLYFKQLQKSLKESLVLKENLEKIERISKTGMTYTNDEGTLDWSKPSFETLKLDPEDYKDYHGNFLDLIIDEDLHYWFDAYNKCSPTNPETITLFRIINGEGKLAYIKCYIVCNYDDNGNEIGHIDFYQDVTEQIERENKLKESLEETLRLEDNLNRIQTSSKTAIGYSEDLNFFTWTPEIYNILEINPEDYKKGTKNLLEKFVIEEDLKLRLDCIKSLSPKHPEAYFTQRIKTGKGNIKYIKTIIHREFDDDGNLIHNVSFNQDITRENEYQIQLETALKDKEILLSEVHHRVKNNLQIVLSLINLNKNFDSDPESILNDTENRIYAMALIHEKIYGSTSLSDVNMKDYIESLVNSLLDTYWSNIQFHSDVDSVDLDMELSIPLGLIINELVINTIKYAFPDDIEGNMYIKFKKEDKHYTLIVRDDGVGLPDNFNIDDLSSLGLIVVQNLTVQIGGTLSIMDCDGTGFKIEFDEE